MRVQFTVEFDRQGNAIIRVNEGKATKMSALKAAAFTEKLAKSMGNITERHVGHHHAELDGKNETHLHEGE